jgi:hypothetical protein
VEVPIHLSHVPSEEFIVAASVKVVYEAECVILV